LMPDSRPFPTRRSSRSRTAEKPTVFRGLSLSRRKSASELVQRLRAAVQRNDAAGEILPADVLPTIGADLAGQFLLIRPRADGLREVDIRLRVRADYLRHRGQRAHQVLLVHGREDGDDRRRKLRDRELATRL